jgi:hypothetical protein
MVYKLGIVRASHPDYTYKLGSSKMVGHAMDCMVYKLGIGIVKALHSD